MSYYRGSRRYPGRGYMYPPMGPPQTWMPSPYWGPRTPEEELEMLQSYKEELKSEKEVLNRWIEETENQIEELQKMIQEGVSQQPKYGTAPFRDPQYYGSAPTATQEKELLEQEARALEEEIKAMKKRLDELNKGE